MKLHIFTIIFTICSINAYQTAESYTDYPIPTVPIACRPPCDQSSTDAHACICSEQFRCVDHVCMCDPSFTCPLTRDECAIECGCDNACQCDANNTNCSCIPDAECVFSRTECTKFCGCSLNCDCPTEQTCKCFDPCKCPSPPNICPFERDQCISICGCQERCDGFCFGNSCTCNVELHCE